MLMGNRTIRLAAALTIGIALAIAAAVSSDRIPVLDDLLASSWVPAVILSVLLVGAAVGIALALPRSRPPSGESTGPEPVIARPTIPEESWNGRTVVTPIGAMIAMIPRPSASGNPMPAKRADPAGLLHDPRPDWRSDGH